MIQGIDVLFLLEKPTAKQVVFQGEIKTRSVIEVLLVMVI